MSMTRADIKERLAKDGSPLIPPALAIFSGGKSTALPIDVGRVVEILGFHGVTSYIIIRDTSNQEIHIVHTRQLTPLLELPIPKPTVGGVTAVELSRAIAGSIRDHAAMLTKDQIIITENLQWLAGQVEAIPYAEKENHERTD